MKNKYLIFGKDCVDNFVLVHAENEKKAFELYCEKVKLEEDFIEDVHDRCVNLSFSERFWEGVLPKDFYELDFDQSEERADIIEKLTPVFEEKIRNYFNHDEYANIFITYSNDYEKEYPDYKLPEELIRFIFKKEVNNYDQRIIINLDEIPHIS